jgi:zinc protease
MDIMGTLHRLLRMSAGMVFVWILMSPGAAAAGSAVSDALADIDIPFQRFVLPNGLTLIVHEDHKSPLVAVNIWYHVGSKDESPGRTGFAHLFEHLMFTSSENHPDEYFRPLLEVGAVQVNGNTWLDRTTYFETVPVNELDRALWLESDRMGHLLGAIDQHKLDEQRGVVQNEKRQGENRPYGKVDELIAASTYPAGHPYSWITSGSLQDLGAATLEDVKSWFRTWYGAANAVLVICGDVQPEAVHQKVLHYFGDIPPGPLLKHAQSWPAKMSGTRRVILQDRVPQTRIYKVWNIPGYTSRDFTLLQMAGDVLADGKNSRLYRRLVYTSQAVSVSATTGPFELGSQLELAITVRPNGNAAAVESAVDEEVARLLKSGPTSQELERLKTTAYARWVRQIERIGGSNGKAAVLGEGELYAGAPDFYRRTLGWLREATPVDVQQAAREWLSDGEFVLTVQPFPDYEPAASGADRSSMPAAGAPAPLVLPPLLHTTLSNGLRVAIAERHGTPVVHLHLIVDAGHAADSLARPGTANLALAMLHEGTRRRDALQIAARAEELAAVIDTGSTLDTSYISLNAVTSRLPDSLELFSDMLLNSTFPPNALARLRIQSIAAIGQQKAQPRGIAGRLFPQLLYGVGHPYGNPFSGSGTEESIRAITDRDLQDFYRRWVRPDNAVLLVVGDTTLDAIRPLLERYLAPWKAPAEPLSVKQPGNALLHAAPRVFLVDRPNAEQTLLMAAAVVPPRSDPDDIAFRAINNVLGGNFISRLNMNLRQDKHWSYGAGSTLFDAKGPRPLLVSTTVQTDRSAEAMQEMARELREIGSSRPPQPLEIRAAQDALVLALPGNTETAGEIAGAYVDILTYGLPDTYLDEFASHVRALTSQQLQAAAARLVQPQALTWIVIGDLAAIEPAIRRLNFGAVQVLDTDGRPLR